MSENKNGNREIDIVGLILLLWSKRKRIIINCFIGGVLSIIVAYSIPKEYTSTVVLAPETSSGSGASGSLGALASMAGVNLGGLSGDEDALYPELYPQIISSTPFLCDLMSLMVETKDGDLSTTLYDYLTEHQKKTWWSKIIKAPIKMIKSMVGTEIVDTIMPTNESGMYMTRKQYLTLVSLNEKISVIVDRGNFVITLNVTMQDPKVAAYVASVVSDKLQEYIGSYRSAKARKDLAYTEMLYKEAQEKYYAAQQAYAKYVDQHQGVVKMQYQIEQNRLSNEQDLAFNVYNQIAQQLEMARAKVSESTPVCVVMQPAIMPIKASAPKKMMIGLLYVFLAFFGTVSWIVVKDRIIDTRSNR